MVTSGLIQCLHCNRNHITRVAYQYLIYSTNPDFDTELIVYQQDHGFFLYVPLDDVHSLLANKGIPPSILDLLLRAQANNCRWVIIEDEGPELDNCPLFKWD